MPPTKCKEENRYRPAAEFDDATLAHKREYWRTKKREQRARLSGSKGKTQRQAERSQQTRNVSLVPGSGLSSSMTVSSSPLPQKSHAPPKVHISPAPSRNGVSKISVENRQSNNNNKKVKSAVVDVVKCLSTGAVVSRSITSSKPSPALLTSPSPVPPVRVMVLPPSSAPCQPQGKVTIINGSSSKVTQQQQRCVVVPKAQQAAITTMTQADTSCVQSQPSTTSGVATGVMLVSSLSSPVPLKAEAAAAAGRPANAKPQLGRKSVSLTAATKKAAGVVQDAPAESEEERAARRRELWRTKKREQRARLAASLAKTRERTQGADAVSQKPGSAGPERLPSHPPSSGRGAAGQRPCFTKVKTPFTDAGRPLKSMRVSVSTPKHAGLSVTKENDGLQAPKLMTFKPAQNQQAAQIKVESPHVDDMTKMAQAAVQIKVESPHVDNMTQTATSCHQQAVQIKRSDVDRMVQAALTSHSVEKLERDVDKIVQAALASPLSSIERQPAGPSKKFPFHPQFYNTNRGITRCRSTRRGFIDTQRSFLGHRSFRGRPPLSHAAAFGGGGAAGGPPRINPNESPEQTAARRREYWRIKKREQRAKQSEEVKAKLKEKDSTMRRVKRYQNILEEMRRARALACNVVTQPTGSTLTHASETIGGFIKEDGTVTINIPHVPIDPTPTIKAPGGLHLLSNEVAAQPQLQPQHHHQSKPGGNTSYSAMLSNPPPPPPPLRPAHVKVSFPLAGQRVNKPPRLLLSRQRSQLESTMKTTASSSPPLIIQRPGQIKLTRPPVAPRGAGGFSGANMGGCVMKMSVSSTGRLEPSRSLAAITLDPELTEEERMAKKREYWRLKKREQRAARTGRLKQGVLQARVSAALQRRRIQKLTQAQNVGASNMTPGRNVPNHAANIQPRPHCTPAMPPQPDKIKQERDSTPAVDLNSQPEQAICPDIKPPAPLPPSLGPQAEPDPAQSADSQATTLLAVASMKKLLEETLSTVSECKSEPADVGAEACALGEDYKDETGGEEKVSVAAVDHRFEKNKSWQGNVCPAPPPELAPHPQASAPPSSTAAPLSESLSNAPSHQRSPAAVLSSPRRAQSLRTKRAVGHQQCCSPEPPKLHHLPPYPQCEQRRQRYERNNSQLTQHQQPLQPRPQQRPGGGREESGGGGANSLQKKREYWRLMKRQQRAKSKARQRDGGGQRVSDRRLSPKNTQSHNLVILNSAKSAQGISPSSKPPIQVRPSTATLTAVTSIPTVLVVSPTTSNTGQPPDTLQVKPPVVSSVSISPVKQQQQNTESFHSSPTFNTTSLPVRSVTTVPSLSNHMADGRLLLVENQPETASNPNPKVRKWTLQVQERTDGGGGDGLAPALPVLTPPDNPLSSMNLQPIEPLGHASSSSCASTPIRIPCPPRPLPQALQGFGVSSPGKLVPISTMVPPKPIPGESEEDFLRRKREYWRVKKKEQRARKAIRDRDMSHKKAPSNWKPLLPAQGQLQAAEAEGYSQWEQSYGDSELQMSTSSDAELGYYSYQAPVEDDFTEYDDNNNNHGGIEDGPVSDAVWRNRYLMDHDPLNQLLVCMVCGDLQYSHSPQVVRAHIEEAHPETLNLDAQERRRVLEAFDEQVSQRERFFTSQLQQHGGALAEAQRN